MAAQTYPAKNYPLRFTLATTLNRLDYIDTNGIFPVGSREIPVYLEITADGVDVYIVQNGTSVQDGALPTHYDKVFNGTTRRWELRGTDPILLAGSAAGTCSITLR